MTTTELPAADTGIGGPVSATMAAELRSWVREDRIIVWLDPEGHYTEFVDRLMSLQSAGKRPYEVRAFRGSWLRLLMALEGTADGTDKTSLVIHLPGLDADAVRRTPVYELYLAGEEKSKQLDVLVTEAAAGRVRPDQIEAFKTQAESGMTLEAADTWLSTLLDDSEGGLSAQLRAMSPTAVFDDLLSKDKGFVARRIANHDDQDTVWERFRSWLGLPPEWRETMLPQPHPRAEDVAFAAASWALCAEYVHDLKRPPFDTVLEPAVSLPRPVIDTCRTVARHLRKSHPDFYQRTADETEALLFEETEKARAEDLGEIDTFRFEEGKVLRAALAALEKESYEQASEWASRRLDARPGAGSFWLRDDIPRQSAWELVRASAALGQAVNRAGTRISAGQHGDANLETAVDAYVERGARVDQAHRQLEQQRMALLYPLLPEFETLRARLDGMRLVWRAWADAWAREFNALCREHGFLPSPARQQRTLFNEVVRPMTQEPGITAYFVVDAMRFEMAAELYEEMDSSPATTVHLRPRLAELPTITEVGMNVLAPVEQNGRLRIALASETGGVKGFQTGEFRVYDPGTRSRAMHDRVGGDTCPLLTLEQVTRQTSSQLRQEISRARLVIVHSREIDNAGEKGVGPAVFDIVLQKLRAAWRLLRDAGVRRFVFTSDHGFLLLDGDSAPAQAHGRPVDPQRRYVFAPVGADHRDEVRVSLADLRYEGGPVDVMFPETTATFYTGGHSANFVHGGNSLQERVIPVLTVTHRAPAEESTVSYRVSAEVLEDVAGMHCVKASVKAVDPQSPDFEPREHIQLALRVPDTEEARMVEDVQVELCQTRGKARVSGGTVIADVGESFEIFFRLTGAADARTLVEIHHPSAAEDVTPFVPDTRFSVTATGTPVPVPASPEPGGGGSRADWLRDFTDPGIRQLFEHLYAHGTVTEEEATRMLGSPRAARRFAAKFDDYAQLAPFEVHIQDVAGVKRYVRGGNA